MPAKKISPAKKQQSFEQAVSRPGLTIARFHAVWCGPCQMLKPVIAELESDNPKVNFVSVDIDQQREVAEQYFVMSVPTVIFFKKGEEVGRMVGFSPKEVYQKKINEFSGAPKKSIYK